MESPDWAEDAWGWLRAQISAVRTTRGRTRNVPRPKIEVVDSLNMAEDASPTCGAASLEACHKSHLQRVLSTVDRLQPGNLGVPRAAL